VDAAQAAFGERRFWNERLPELLSDVGLEDPPETYDDLIIDEGQDFRGAWVDALRLFLRPAGSLFVFRDDFQNVYGRNDLAGTLRVTPMPLCENVRNTQEIFAAASRFRDGSDQRCLGPRGEDVRWITAPPDRTVRVIERELNRLIATEGVLPHDIAVLTGCAVEEADFPGDALGRHSTAPADAPMSGKVVLDSVRRFKGLDRAVVILCRMEHADDLAYVGLTRARSLLLVVASEECLERLRGRAT
jgi:superfamily I DNA/RNA helicase